MKRIAVALLAVAAALTPQMAAAQMRIRAGLSS
jgi:hypothetical protein